MGSEITALSKAYGLTVWTAERVARFPRTHHYTIGQRMVTAIYLGAGYLRVRAGRDACATEKPVRNTCPTQTKHRRGRGADKVMPARIAARASVVAQASVPASSYSGRNPIAMSELPSFTMYRRRLPHWRLSGSTYFVTWRLRRGQHNLTPAERTLVMSAIKHFEHQRSELMAFVVMDDHVHVLVEPLGEHRLRDITHTWKSYTSRCFQRRTGRQGSVWLVESFDRVVRDEAELLEKAQYILNNPRKRWPRATEYPWVWVQGQEG